MGRKSAKIQKRTKKKVKGKRSKKTCKPLKKSSRVKAGWPYAGRAADFWADPMHGGDGGGDIAAAGLDAAGDIVDAVLTPTGFVIGGALALGAYALNENRKKKKKKDESSEQDGGGSWQSGKVIKIGGGQSGGWPRLKKK